jgi:hypothetical protein
MAEPKPAAKCSTLSDCLGELWFTLDQAGAVAYTITLVLPQVNPQAQPDLARVDALAGAVATLVARAKSQLDACEAANARAVAR